ncbi:hypothetical protein GBAR_LOCUS25080 [Geodia barretti]|uniref:Uncharacterized protein n=1 Tax=Geodia barretti TaxID=519541 RepID=A0AA35X5V0_GEOBA|nr:hypothetical protein GBAR_LOCUS25080 [Geodia barretti]
MVQPIRVMNMLVTFLLIAIFAAAGVMKLTPIISPEVHNELKGNFGRFVAVPPMNILQLGPDVYRTLVGVVELACVACLACPHSKIQLVGHYALLLVMLGPYGHTSSSKTQSTR